MTVCRFYLEGRCRYGDRCWNEHPAPASPQRRNNYSYVAPSAGYHGSYSQAPASRNYSSGQQRDFSFRQSYNPQYYSKSSSPIRDQYSDRYTWEAPSPGAYYDNHSLDAYERGGGTQQKNSPFHLRTGNKFEVLDNAKSSSRNDQESPQISMLKNEVIEWEMSQIWPFSCHGHLKDNNANLSGFVDISPEELRYRAYEAEKSGVFPSYTQTVAAASDEIRKKWNVLKNPTADVLQSVLKGYHGTSSFCEENLKKLIPDGTAGSSFSMEQMNNERPSQPQTQSSSSMGFSFKQAFTVSSPPSNNSSFGSVLPISNKVEGSSAPFPSSSSGFGSSSAATSSSFGFGSSLTSPSGFVTPSLTSGFGSSSSLFGAAPTSSASSGFGSSTLRKAVVDTDMKSTSTYTPLENLSETEKAQFSSQTFTLGKIPSRPPPMELCF